jgi:hypothetical protein
MTTLPLEIIEQDRVQEIPDSSIHSNVELFEFLKEELGLTESSIALALRYCEQERGTLPMILWRYGFVSLDQLNQIFDWLAR